MEDNVLIGDPIDRHQNQSQNFEETNTRTNQQQNIVEIEAYSASDYDGIGVGGASKEGTDDKYDEFETTLWFRQIFPLLLIFRKLSFSLIVVFRT